MRKALKTRIVCIILSLMLLLQIAPLSAFANEAEIKEEISNILSTSSDQEDTLSVVCEIEESRTEYSKDFLLSDGSYYCVATTSPMHTEVEGNWENISDSLNVVEETSDLYELTNTLASVVSAMSSQSENTVLTYSSQSTETIDTNVPKSLLSKEYSATSGFGINYIINAPDGAIKANTNDINSYLLSDIIVKEANIAFSYQTSSENVLYAYEGRSESATSSTIKSFKLIDKKTVSGSGEISFDITDTINRWSLGVIDNNGIVIRSTGSANIIVNSFMITLNYEVVDPNDIDFTYHTIDMGNAGCAFINNYTNTMWVEQPILDIDSAVLPESISLINNSVRPICEEGVIYGFTINIESTISISGNSIIWNTFEYEKKYFQSDELALTEGEYQIWREIGHSDYQDNTSVLLHVPMSNIEAGTINLGNVFVSQGDTKYRFNSDGKLISIERPGANNITTQVILNYDSSGRIRRLETEKNKVYLFTYAVSDIGFENISQITVENNSDNVSFSMSVDSDENGNAIARTEITTIGGEKIINETDVYGNILKITNYNGCSWNFEHKVDESANTAIGNKVLAYSKHIVDSEGNSTEEYSIDFLSPNGYYREITKVQGSSTYNEIIQYDRDYHIITHKDFNGKYICAEYDENGIISSFAFNENVNDNKISDGSFENTGIGTSNAWNINENGSAVVASTFMEFKHGGYELKISPTTETEIRIGQEVNKTFKADNTYVIGAWVKVNNTIPSEDKKIGIEVRDSEGNIITFVSFDNGLDGEWQYRVQAFKLDRKLTSLDINITAIHQIGDIRFDEVTLFEAVDSQADLNNIVTSSPIISSYNEDGTISNETMTDGVYSMGQAYVYDNNGNIIETKDINGLIEYYQYSPSGKWIGTEKNSDGEIEDATQLVYDSFGVLQTVSKTINSVTTGNNKTIQTIYGTENGKISSVYHGGVQYIFDYNQNGTLSCIDISPKESSDEPALIEYGYTGASDIGYIIYKNGYEIDYTYDSNGNITLVECFSVDFENDTTNLIKSFEYTYNNGQLAESFDSRTGYSIVYSGTGYSINAERESETESVELYNKTKNANGETVETFRQAYFTDSNNTLSDIITTSENVVSANSSNGNVTNSSSVTVNKNASDNKHSTMNYSRSSVSDYFNRVINKNTALMYDAENNNTFNVVSDTNYEYKLLDVGVTSGLISSYTSTVSGDNGVSGADLTEYESYSRKYEYDHKGNIKYVYAQDGATVTPKEYYEYDDANQLITSIDFNLGRIMHYTYDVSGNLASKIYYNSSNLQFDHENRTIISLGEPYKEERYSYDMSTAEYTTVDYTATDENYTPEIRTIEYDEMGNPKYYIGVDVDNAEVTGNLEWNGNLLSAFENDKLRIEYEYDLNGYRSTKTVYEKKVISGSLTLSFMYKMSYIWDNGVLQSLLYVGGNCEETSINIIYDQEGSPVGYITSMGLPYYFIKDVNENVLGLIHPDGTKLCSISYDAWGTPSFTYYGDNFLLEILAKMTAIFNPVTYHGYIYDYETGMYCNQGRCYSPKWGRYLNPETPTSLLEYSENVLDANLYLFCNNNPMNNIDHYASWSRDYIEYGWNARGFNVEMNEMFASRSFCTVFANQFLREYGEWDAETGYTYNDMDSLRIASDLFAHYVGKSASAAINKVNASWGEGWLSKCNQLDRITIKSNDANAWKYEKVWFAAPEIKAYAWSEGVFITL